MFVFATDEFLIKLAQCEEIWWDGTFYACKDLMGQLYTIHALVNGQMFCLVYALHPGFSADVYKELYRFLQDRIYQLGEEQHLQMAFSPKRLTSDFEAAAISAIEAVHPQADVSGCHFHFCQCLWRSMQKKNLQERYCATNPVEDSLRRLFKRLCLLSLIPASKVQQMYDTIYLEAMEHYHSDQDVLGYFSYFVATWMSKISLWNHYKNFVLVKCI